MGHNGHSGKMMHIGNGSFWLGDCLELMRHIPNGSVDCVVTDIPYNEVNRKSSGLRKLDKGIADAALFDELKFIHELKRVCKGSIYIFCGIKQISSFINEFEILGFSTRLGVWNKTNPSPMNGQYLYLSGLEACVFARKSNAVFNRHCKNAIWTMASIQSKIHPTQKPINLFRELIETSSNPGDLIFDPFAGSGTTAIAAQRTGRRWLCIEREPSYYYAACGRIASEVHGK